MSAFHSNPPRDLFRRPAAKGQALNDLESAETDLTAAPIARPIPALERPFSSVIAISSLSSMASWLRRPASFVAQSFINGGAPLLMKFWLTTS
jgi:hypothetical protein